jgi:hypothetical protein
VDPNPSRRPNPEAIAWYLARSERLLDDLRERFRALLSRCGQLAGFSGAVLALVGANAHSILASLHDGTRKAAGLSLLFGSFALIAAFVTALRGSAVPRGVSDVSAREAAGYLLPRFTSEPDLWRVQLRTVKALVTAIDATTQQVDAINRAVAWATRFFLAGLAAVGIALAILVLVVTFE